MVDSFSTDDTISIVKKSNAILLQRKFDNFSNQKNYAIQQANHDWIIWIDADEVLTSELQKEIRDAVNNPCQNVGFYISRIFFLIDVIKFNWYSFFE